MRHNVDGRKFGRNTSHRVAMLKNIANAVIQKEQITTTIQKAKEVRRVVDKLITLGKKNTDHSRRIAFARTRDKIVVQKLFGPLAERYKARAGGYTRVLRLADRRWGDAAEMAILELVDHPEINRKRVPRAQPQGGAQDDANAKPADPLKGFRKMFGGKSKVAGEKAAPKAAKAPKANRKTMAGGGSSKSGGGGSA